VIEQPRDRQAIPALEGPHRRLRLRGKAAVDRARIEPEGLQMGFRQLDIPARQGPVERDPVEPGRRGRGGPG